MVSRIIRSYQIIRNKKQTLFPVEIVSFKKIRSYCIVQMNNPRIYAGVD